MNPQKRFPLSSFSSRMLLMLCILGGLIGAPPGVSAAEKKDLPPRSLSVSPEYTGVVVPQGEDVSMDLIVANRGQSSEDVSLSLPEIPEGWDARITTYSFQVTGIHVESDTTKRLTLKAEPGEDVSPGTYTFSIEARSADGKLKETTRLRVTVTPKEEAVKTRDVSITTSYPVLQGPTDAEFEFSVDVENKLSQDTTYNLSAQGPKDWEIRFKPAYEEKLISSLRIKAGQSKSTAVVVKPQSSAGPGEYPVRVKVSSDQAQAEVDLMVVLTGTHKVEVGTVDGLLSLRTQQGKTATLSFYVKNSGSAPQQNLRFLSFQPENWEVTFEPESMDILPPGELRQVVMSVTPSEQALVGDYSVSLAVQGTKVSKDLELRVTVRASTVWGWVGIGLILFVIAGLVILFIRMGRR